MDHSRDLPICSSHESRTCCTRESIIGILNSVKNTYQLTVTGSVMSDECRDAFIENSCSICDAEVGTGLASSGNRPTLCYNTCEKFYQKCRNDLFEPTVPGYITKPCTETNSHICSTPKEMFGNAQDFCSSLGFEVFPEWTESSFGVPLDSKFLKDPVRDLLESQNEEAAVGEVNRASLPSLTCFNGTPSAKRFGPAVRKARDVEAEREASRKAAEWRALLDWLKSIASEWGLKGMFLLGGMWMSVWWTLNSDLVGFKKWRRDRREEARRQEVRKAAEERMRRMLSAHPPSSSPGGLGVKQATEGVEHAVEEKKEDEEQDESEGDSDEEMEIVHNQSS
eukprot:GDKK01037826.1.p1 GENE.GDKK01037826.1~~GDKK01037826.1.p1  ORF type:complete len:382 (+),score=77.53 GDKK01037826.1:133-1146(+)